ncbi:hypothetical protein [Saccharomonospora piscinae]|uniref:hypothetical protein n=1 Tax=Saccharomonospora piscinae TaxID=687388 RepID=UPI00207BA79D|nr:hypothetical protein [Saccharomonospora piscinae]
MRTTIDLPDDLHRLAQSLARDTSRSLSDIVAELMRRKLAITRSPADSWTDTNSTDADRACSTTR